MTHASIENMKKISLVISALKNCPNQVLELDSKVSKDEIGKWLNQKRKPRNSL